MLTVTNVDYIRDYELMLEFSDGAIKKVNLEPHLKGEMFEELRDHSEFVQFGLTLFTLEWANGADFAPEFLYEIGVEASAEEKKAFKTDFGLA